MSVDKNSKRGDTLIEVVLAFAMFSLVAAISIAVMNSSITSAEASLELTLARTEIDAQSETLRHIHSSYSNDRAYSNLWRAIVKRSLNKDEIKNLPVLSTDSYSSLYEGLTNTDGGPTIYDAKAFVVNPRKVVDSTDVASPEYYGHTIITADDQTTDEVKFTMSSLNPRLVYTSNDIEASDTDEDITETKVYDQVARVEGIYDAAVADSEHGDKPYYYDFHIYTCWFPPGAERPTTIGTITRLYNPEFVK